MEEKNDKPSGKVGGIYLIISVFVMVLLSVAIIVSNLVTRFSN